MQSGLVNDWAREDGFSIVHHSDVQSIKPIRPLTVEMSFDGNAVDVGSHSTSSLVSNQACAQRRRKTSRWHTPAAVATRSARRLQNVPIGRECYSCHISPTDGLLGMVGDAPTCSMLGEVEAPPTEHAARTSSARSICCFMGRPAEDAAVCRVVPLFLYDIVVTLERDVGAILIERAKDADAFVTDFITEASRTEPTSPRGIGGGLDQLMRGDVDLGISSSVVIGAAAQTVALCQGIAGIRQGRVEDDASRRPKTEVISTGVTNGRTTSPQEGATDELIQGGVDEEQVGNPRHPPLHAHRMRDFIPDIGILEERGGWIGGRIHKCAR